VDILDPNMVLYAYTKGIFPMAHSDEDHAIYWHEPIIRGIIPLEEFKVSKNLRRLYRSGKFDQYINRNFEGVIRACAAREETWISEEIIQVFMQLHDMGYAHSFETWHEGKLVGGLYGVAMGRAFFGESMFHEVTDASKTALVFLVEFLKEKQFSLLDTQYITEHLRSFGAIEIPQAEYLKLLEEALM
jgi:leucyl/phenylalanyl-tRNA--protein transferase